MNFGLRFTIFQEKYVLLLYLFALFVYNQNNLLFNFAITTYINFLLLVLLNTLSILLYKFKTFNYSLLMFIFNLVYWILLYFV